MRARGIALLFIASGILLFLTGCSASIIRQAIQQADTAIQDKKYDQATTILETQLQKYPYSQPLLIKKAELVRTQQDYSGFLDLQPRLSVRALRNYPELQRREVIALIKTNHVDQANQRLDDLLSKSPGNADRLQLKGQLAYLQEQMDEAIDLYDQALASDSTNTEALVNKAVALADRGDLLESLDLLDSALQLAPDDYLIRYNKGTVLSDLGFQQKSLLATGAFSYFSEALRHFEKAYMLHPESTDTLIRLGITYLDLGNTEKAHSALEVALSQDPALVDAWYYEGKTYLAENDIQEAKTTFEHLLTIDPEYELAQQELIDIKQEQGTGDEILE